MERVLLPRDPRTPRRARQYLAPRLSRLGMPPEAAEELLVAVGEAVTNAVLHGAGGDSPAAGNGRQPGSMLPAAGAFPRRKKAAPASRRSGAAAATASSVAADVVMVELLAHGDRVAVAVTSPSSRWRVPRPDCPEPIADFGRGLYLMRHLADSVRIEQGRRGTTVYLIRRLRHGESV